MMLTGRSTVADAAADFSEKTKAAFAITLGKEGTLLGLKGETRIIPSIKITAVDTTGAGDAFTGAVLYQLADTSLEEIKAMTAEQWSIIISNGNKAGARTCEYLGAMEAFKHLSNDIFK